MPKNIVQDIVPPERRSIRDIPLPNRPMKKELPVSPPSSDDFATEEPKVYRYEENNLPSSFRGNSKKTIWIGVVVAVIIVVFAVASLFTKATILVTPASQSIEADSSVVLGASRTATGKELSFDIIKLSKSGGKEVPANGEEKVEKKASGIIVVYNNADTSSQRLIKNTRFETPDGLIFRINESVVVPEKKTVDGKTVPGSVEVTVYADIAGEKYNIGKSDFTIPGFKSDALRYKEIYARSKTDMTGGFVGMMRKVSETDMKSAQDEIHSRLESELKEEAKSKVPENFVLFSDASIVENVSLPQTEGNGSKVTINEEATLYGILIPKEGLANYLASKFIPELELSDLEISNLTELQFSLQNKGDLDPRNLEKISFSISGPVTFISRFDESKLKEDIVGKSKKELTAILSNYPSIKTAESTIRPVWKRTFPDDITDIEIRTQPSI